MRIFTAIAVALGAALLASAPPAMAATRYVVPSYGVASGSCPQSAPCTAAYALNSSVKAKGLASGDTVEVASGGYDLDDAPIKVGRRLDIRGEPGHPRPLFASNADQQFLFDSHAAGTTIDHVAFAGTNRATLEAGVSLTLNDVDVQASLVCARLDGGDYTITNSTLEVNGQYAGDCISVSGANVTVKNVGITSSSVPLGGTAMAIVGSVTANVDDLRVNTGGDGVAIYATDGIARRLAINAGGVALSAGRYFATGSGVSVTDSLVQTSGRAAISTGPASFRNVNAIATGDSGIGFEVLNSDTSGYSVSAVNSVFRGASKDVSVVPDETQPYCDPATTQCPPRYHVSLTLSHTNYRTSDGPIEAEDASQSGDPLFRDPDGGDYRVQAGSPLIDAGVDAPANGPVDLAGALRNQGAAPDIGAYESGPATGGGSSGGGGGENQNPFPNGPPATDKIAPKLSHVTLTNARFAVGKGATPATAARARAGAGARRIKRGTTFVYSTSEAARVTIAVQRRAAGRRAKGGKCVKATRRNRRAKNCVRWLGRGKLSRVAAKGANAVPFSGRIGRRALGRGRYRAVFSAVDLSGNRSGAKSLGFTIVHG